MRAHTHHRVKSTTIIDPQAFVDAGVPHVICVKIDTRLHDAHAVIFTHHFYVALAQGLSVEVSILIVAEG